MIYDVQTERFGALQYEADDIAEARQWARLAHGVMNKRCVTLHREYNACERCESRPCTCEGAS